MAVPKLRFKEFDGDWGKTTILDISTLVTKGTTPKVFVEGRINFLKIEAINGNSFDLAKCQTISDEIHEKELKRSILQEGDILFAIAGATIGKNAIVTESILPANTNQALAIIRLDDKDGKDFVSKVLNSPFMEKYIESNISTGAQPNLNLQQIGNFAFNLPSKPEQTKIASFLSEVDEKISQLTQKHELLSQYKQGMMQKLFSQQIRFKADDGSEFGEWEISKFDEVLSTISIRNNQIQASQILEEGDIPVIDQGQKYIAGYTQVISKILEPKSGLIIFGDHTTFLKYVDFSFVVGADGVKVLEVEKNSLSKYVYYYLCHNKLQPEGYKRHFTILREIEILVPCLAEQTKIANFLSAIDQKIEVVAQQIEQAKTWKKGLLQQMFV